MNIRKSIVTAAIAAFIGFTCGSVTYGASKNLATGYRVADQMSLENMCSKLYGAAGDTDSLELGNGDAQELVNYIWYEYGLGSQPDVNDIRDYSGNIRISYSQQTRQALETHRQADAWIASRVSGLTPDLETVKQLFVDIVNNVNYDYTYINNTAYSAIFRKSSTCNGISHLFKRELELLDIESYYVLGYASDGGFHAWNAFVLDGQEYVVDATWAIGFRGTDGIWQYFQCGSDLTLGDGRTATSVW